MKNFLMLAISASLLVVLSSKATWDAPITLDWRFNEFRQRGIKVEEVFSVKCILGYYYHIWPDQFVSIPVLDSNLNRIKCIDRP